MQIEFLVEERSAEAALRNLLPKMLRAGHVFNVRVFDGKTDLLSKLPSRLRGYRRWLPRDSCIVVLVDEDREDCRELKDRLENDAAQAKLLTKTAAHGRRRFQVVNRLAVEELEHVNISCLRCSDEKSPGCPVGKQHRAPERWLPPARHAFARTRA